MAYLSVRLGYRLDEIPEQGYSPSEPLRSSRLWFSPAVRSKNEICTHKRPRTRDGSGEPGKDRRTGCQPPGHSGYPARRSAWSWLAGLDDRSAILDAPRGIGFSQL